jgi:hypothetical protein
MMSDSNQQSKQMLSSKVPLEMLCMGAILKAITAQVLNTSHIGSLYLEASLPWTQQPLLFVRRIAFLVSSASAHT